VQALRPGDAPSSRRRPARRIPPSHVLPRLQILRPAWSFAGAFAARPASARLWPFLRRIRIRKPRCIEAFRGNVNHVALAVQTRVQLYSTSLRVHLSLDRQRFVKMIRWGDGSLAVPLIRKAPAPCTVSSRGPAAQHLHCTDDGRAEGSTRLAARLGRGSVAKCRRCNGHRHGRSRGCRAASATSLVAAVGRSFGPAKHGVNTGCGETGPQDDTGGDGRLPLWTRWGDGSEEGVWRHRASNQSRQELDKVELRWG